jgi:hypothetical protein
MEGCFNLVLLCFFITFFISSTLLTFLVIIIAFAPIFYLLINFFYYCYALTKKSFYNQIKKIIKIHLDKNKFELSWLNKPITKN